MFPKIVHRQTTYWIGVGGGATSSQIQGASDKDMNAVQRGDAEMENRMNRLLRACIEMDEVNPILSIHDQVNYVSNEKNVILLINIELLSSRVLVVMVMYSKKL